MSWLTSLFRSAPPVVWVENGVTHIRRKQSDCKPMKDGQVAFENVDLRGLSGIMRDTGVPDKFRYYSRDYPDITGPLPAHIMTAVALRDGTALRMVEVSVKPVGWPLFKTHTFTPDLKQWIGGADGQTLEVVREKDASNPANGAEFQITGFCIVDLLALSDAEARNYKMSDPTSAMVGVVNEEG